MHALRWFVRWFASKRRLAIRVLGSAKRQEDWFATGGVRIAAVGTEQDVVVVRDPDGTTFRADGRVHHRRANRGWGGRCSVSGSCQGCGW